LRKVTNIRNALRAFRNSDKQSISKLKQTKEHPFQAHQKAPFFWSLLTLSEHAFPFTEELFRGYETPSPLSLEKTSCIQYP